MFCLCFFGISKQTNTLTCVFDFIWYVLTSYHLQKPGKPTHRRSDSAASSCSNWHFSKSESIWAESLTEAIFAWAVFRGLSECRAWCFGSTGWTFSCNAATRKCECLNRDTIKVCCPAELQFTASLFWRLLEPWRSLVCTNSRIGTW